MAKVCRSKGKVISSSIKSVDDMKDEHHEIVLSIDEVVECDQLIAESMPVEESVDEMCSMEFETFYIDGELALGKDEWEEAIRNDVEYDELKRFIVGQSFAIKTNVGGERRIECAR
ncbi:hypothetical protein NDU88_002789 [Pleurodeles waltl]|uniref:Uncharacterized protein n=1 Tax=Pleurodeles waltl TaxID=8319 RepID=A0AAV7UWM4_PLEWA|nr:hypothetical protein NDU88_002789 [Pleurodeles waltl]